MFSPVFAQDLFLARNSSVGTKVRASGQVTMWAEESALIGAQCEFANDPINSVTDKVLTPYMRNGFHCAIGDEFGNGEHCGKCFRITSLNDDGIYGTPGHKGSAVIQITNGGSGGP